MSATLIAAIAGLPLATAGPAAAADPVTFLPNGGTAQQYTVPAGVTSIQVLAVGGTGGRGGAVSTKSRAPGGRGGTVLTTIPVVQGELITVVVGANGEGGGAVAGAVGGQPRGGRGGGKTTVLTCRSSSPCPDGGPVAIYAGGGGGGGGRGASGPGTNGGTGASVGAAKGGAGTTGVVYVAPAQGGTSGTDVAGPGGGRGTVTDCTGTNGSNGTNGSLSATGVTTPGNGGAGASDGGGGGGGGGDGWRPGGGGGGGAGCAPSTEADGGGGGGGAGSSHVDGADATFGTDATATPRVVFTPISAPPTDTTAPTVTIDQASGQADPATSSPIRFTATFSEPVQPLTAGDIVLTGSTGGTVTTVTDGGDHRTYTIDVTGMTTAGTVTATIPAGATADTAGNPNTASTSTDNTVTYQVPPTDTTAPTVTIDQASGQADPATSSPIRFTATFSEPVEPLTAGDIVLTGSTGGTVTTVTDSGDHRTYTIDVTGMTTAGTVTATIPAGATADTAGNPNTASTSTDNTVTYQPVVVPPAPTLQITPRVDVLEGRVAQLQLTLSAPASTPVIVQLDTADGPTFSGASASQWLVPDYVAGPRSVTIPAGSTTAAVNVATNLDFYLEPWESFTVRVTSASPGVELGNRAANVTIWDAAWWWAFPQ